MPTVSTTTPLNFPTLLSLVTRVRREVTRETLASLTNDAINNVIVDSINDAVEDIYYKDRWNWKKSLYNVKLIASQSDYALPPDFYQIATEPTYNGIMMVEVEPEQWTRYTYDPQITATLSSGSPVVYMVDRALFRVHPTPSSDTISIAPHIQLVYYRRPPSRLTITSDSSNPPDLPPEFIEAVISFAKWKLKIHLQFDDFELEEKRYMQVVQRQIENDYLSVHPVRVRPRNWSSANFG